MKTFLRIAVEIVVLVLIVIVGLRLYIGRSTASYSGSSKAAVSAPVDIVFDAKAIPQIWAATDADAYYALGRMHAAERLFQMELVRRVARGELAELFGKPAFEADLLQRRLGFVRRADASRLTPPARLALERYAAGVNDQIEAASVLPPEFLLLRLKPRAWTVEDSLAIIGYQSWYAHQLSDRSDEYAMLIGKLGVPGSALTRAGHPWSPATVSEGASPLAPAEAALQELAGATGQRVTAASNSWAIAPSRSTSGAALHASDPHLAIDQFPGLWYLVGLHSNEGLSVVGASFTGAPLVAMGHNGTIAFSFTVASVDVIDHYLDRPVRSATELIKVKGEARPRRIEIQYGTRGVMIEPKTSMRWAGFDFSPAAAVDAGLRLQKAKNFDEFRRAVTGLGALNANWVYSDRAGNVGYQLGTPLPLRDFNTHVRQPATPRTAWRGYRPLEQTPFVLNPAQGYVASANNQIVPQSWGYEIPGFYDPYRIARIATLVKPKNSASDMKAMQLDVVSGIALRWKKLAVEGARAAGMNQEAQALESWDGAMRSDSSAAALFAAWWRLLPRHVFEDELGDRWEAGRGVIDEALTLPSRAIDDRRTPVAETAVQVSSRAMLEARDLVRGRTWGEICVQDVRHPLAQAKLVNRLLNLSRGPFPASGDAGSINANFHRFDEKSRTFRTRVGASMRFVLDWSNVDAFTLTGSLGQSGNPFSSHYDDFLEMSREGESWTVPFTKEKVFAAKKSLLRLEPR